MSTIKNFFSDIKTDINMYYFLLYYAIINYI